MLNNPPLKNRLFFRGGRASIFPLALIALFLMTLVIAAYSLGFAKQKNLSSPSSPAFGGSSSNATPKGDTKAKSDNKQTVEKRPETKAREGITAREPVKRP